MVECDRCQSNVIEVDDTPNFDGARSIAHCMVCGNDITL